MSGLVPFNLRGNNLTRSNAGFENFYNMLDDFFHDSSMPSSRNLLKDTFKIDIEEKDTEYTVEAELPGVKKEEIDLNVEENVLSIFVNRVEESNSDGKNYIHRERRSSSVSRRVRLEGAKLDEIKAKLEDGVLSVTIPKDVKTITSRKIDIE
jgi:HSP20 family protein